MQKQQTNAFWLKTLEITTPNMGTLVLFGHFKNARFIKHNVMSTSSNVSRSTMI